MAFKNLTFGLKASFGSEGVSVLLLERFVVVMLVIVIVVFLFGMFRWFFGRPFASFFDFFEPSPAEDDAVCFQYFLVARLYKFCDVWCTPCAFSGAILEVFAGFVRVVEDAGVSSYGQVRE